MEPVKLGPPGKPSGFSGERRNTEMSELSRLQGSEGYGSCDDASAVWLASAISVTVGITAAKLFEKVWLGPPVKPSAAVSLGKGGAPK